MLGGPGAAAACRTGPLRTRHLQLQLQPLVLGPQSRQLLLQRTGGAVCCQVNHHAVLSALAATRHARLLRLLCMLRGRRAAAGRRQRRLRAGLWLAAQNVIAQHRAEAVSQDGDGPLQAVPTADGRVDSPDRTALVFRASPLRAACTAPTHPVQAPHTAPGLLAEPQLSRSQGAPGSRGCGARSGHRCR